MFLSRVAGATDRTENFWLSPSGYPTVYLAPVVQKGDSAIHWINVYAQDNAIIIVSLIFIHWIVIYLVDNAIQLLNNWGQDLITVK